MKPLAGRRILDLSKVIAGPLCTQYLAGLGAEVTKVETPHGGDDTRRWPPLHGDTGATFLALNRGKRSIALDLKSEAGRGIVLELAQSADVVIESFAPEVKSRLGLSPADLRARNPRLVYCSISGFGQAGPLRDALGYDAVLQAFSGLMSLNGEPDGEPARLPGSPIDQLTGLHATIGILAALMERDRSGHGASLEVSLFETATSLLGPVLQGFWEEGVAPPRMGSSHPTLCPYQTFETADTPVLIGVANERLWRRFCGAIGRPDLVEDPRYRTNIDRLARQQETTAMLQAIIGARSSDHWMQALSAVDVPCAPVNTLGQLLAHPHTAARGVVLDYDDPRRGPLHAVATPIVFDGAPREAGSPPPALGEHTRAILSELGYTAEAAQALEAAGHVVSGG